MTVVLVINSGSSSFKYQLIDVESESALASGLVERIGEGVGAMTHKVGDASYERELPIPDHAVGFEVMLRAFDEYGPSLVEQPPAAIGHRVVQGGARFFHPTLIDDLVEINIDELAVLAPLHNPGAVQGIRAARTAFSDLPHVAVFDTAFHQSLPPAAYTYAIDQDLARKHRIRRYGFHGTSHKFVSEAAADFVGRPLRELKQIVLHLGNGASITAIDGGLSVETSMGLTPLEGLVMGTRSGDIDPAVVVHLQRVAGMSTDELDDLLNRRSGMLGLSGSSDMRDVHDAVEAGDERARTALQVYYHRIRAYVGAYYAQLGRVDAIAFTAGIGENDDIVRINSLAGLERLGIAVDAERNEGRKKDECVISPDGSEVTVFVIAREPV